MTKTDNDYRKGEKWQFDENIFLFELLSKSKKGSKEEHIFLWFSLPLQSNNSNVFVFSFFASYIFLFLVQIKYL